MRPDVVTFWHGPIDALRQTCLRSQLAAGHNVTVYSFDPIPELPDGVRNACAESVLPQDFSAKLRPPQADGSWRDWTVVQFSDFFRMRLMRQGAGLWLDTDVLLLHPVEIDPDRPYFAWERPRQLGNSVLYLQPDHPIVTAFEELMEQEDLTPPWLTLRHRITYMTQRLCGRSERLADIRVAVFGPPALTALARLNGCVRHALPEKTFYAVHADPGAFFDPKDSIDAVVDDPDIIGLHISPKKRCVEQPKPGSLYAWARERFATQ